MDRVLSKITPRLFADESPLIFSSAIFNNNNNNNFCFYIAPINFSISRALYRVAIYYYPRIIHVSANRYPFTAG